MSNGVSSIFGSCGFSEFENRNGHEFPAVRISGSKVHTRIEGGIRRVSHEEMLAEAFQGQPEHCRHAIEGLHLIDAALRNSH